MATIVQLTETYWLNLDFVYSIHMDEHGNVFVRFTPSPGDPGVLLKPEAVPALLASLHRHQEAP